MRFIGSGFRLALRGLCLLSPTAKNGMKLADQRSHFSFKMDSLHRLQAQCLHR